MKKFLSVLLAVSILTAIIVPGTVFAGSDDDNVGRNGIEILKKNPPGDLKNLGQNVKKFIEEHRDIKWHLPSEPAGFVGAPVKGERYAVIIGISDYPGAGSILEGGMDLFYADDDAQAVFNMLVGVQGFNPANITMLTDSGATKSAVVNALASLKKKVNRNDEVVFYFSGHSARYSDIAARNLSRIGNKVGILVWADDLNENFPVVIWDKELKTAFNSLRTDRIVFGFDCCYAAGFSDLAGLGRIVVMASDGDGISGEYGEAYSSVGATELPGMGWLNQGLFTYFFIVQGLTWGLADVNGDGIATVEEGFAYAKPILEMWTEQAQSQGQPLDEIPVMIDLFWGDLDL